VLRAVGGAPVAGRRKAEVTRMLKGPAGSVVELLLERRGEVPSH